MNYFLKKLYPRRLGRLEPKIVYTGNKLSAKFQIKDKIKNDHKHDLLCHAKYPECDESYLGETGRRLQDRVNEHSRKNSRSNILRHSYQDDPKMCPETISKFLEMDTKR